MPSLRHILALGCLLAFGRLSSCKYSDPHCNGRQVIVHLFEWSWNAVARECEEVLGPKGYCGVQISPPNEHLNAREWWARYQPVSYRLESRSGTREEFASMVERCNAAGVMVIADLVFNHMTTYGYAGIGYNGSLYDGEDQNYPGVPYSTLDFHHPYCEIHNYQDAQEVRNCYLGGLNDLDGSKVYVRQMIDTYANDLVDLGVKGFRVDAAKHMWPEDLEAMQEQWDNVGVGTAPFVFHEVIDYGGEAVTMGEYYHLGKVTEFRAGGWFACIKTQGLDCLEGYPFGLGDGMHSLTFVDNHDTQRHSDVLTYKDDYWYKLATAFHMAHEYGFKRVMSSYEFSAISDLPPEKDPEGAGHLCGNGWVCEHRWSTIADMAQFANAVAGKPVENWQLRNNDRALGFSRGSKGFVAIGELQEGVLFYTGLPDGQYCDLIHECGQMITVGDGGWATITQYQANDPVVAFCVGCH